MLNPWLLLAIVIGWGASVAAAGWAAYGAGQDKCIAEQARDAIVAQIAADAAGEATAKAISKIEVRNVTIQQKLQREVIERQVFRDCRSGDDARLLFNSAIPAAADKPAAAAVELPASNPAR